MIEARVAETKIVGPNQVIPTFRLPQPRNGDDQADDQDK